MNRAERRKNKIKSEKGTECQYTKEELRDFFKQELLALRNESYSEWVRRKAYKRLENLIKEYEKQHGKSETIVLKEELRSSLQNSQDERVKAYVKQRQELRLQSSISKIAKNFFC